MKKRLPFFLAATLALLIGCSPSAGNPPNDETPPSPGNGGTLSFSGITESSLTVEWTKASDASTADTGLLYRVYRSTSDNIKTVAQCENAGTAINDYTANIASISATGLMATTPYYFNVIVKDAAGNKACYTSGSTSTNSTPDTTPPVLSALYSSDVAATTAQISATTNKYGTIHFVVTSSATAPTAANIKAGKGADGASVRCGSNTARANQPFSVSLTELSPLTKYYYYFVAVDSLGKESSVLGGEFTTTNGADVTAPTLSGLTANQITSTSACVYATPNESGTIYYVLSAANSAPTADEVIAHSMASAIANGSAASHASQASCFSPTGLTPDTTYYYYFAAVDVAGNKSAVSGSSFSTKEATPPTLSSVGSTVTGPTTASISATSNENGFVYYVVSTAVIGDPSPVMVAENLIPNPVAHGTVTVTAGTAVTIPVSGLSSETEYSLYVVAEDIAGNRSAASHTYLTTPDLTPPTLSSVDVVSIEANAATITAKSSENGTIYYAIATADSAPTASQVIAGTVTAKVTFGSEVKPANESLSYKITGLSDSTTYYCFIVALDATANASEISKKTFKTLDATPPTLSGVYAGNLTATSTILYATASEDATVYYAVTTAATTPTAAAVIGGTVSGTVKAGNVAATAATPISASVAGLSPETNYWAYVVAVDAAGNRGAVSSMTLTTPDLTPPTLSSVDAVSIEATAATITAMANEGATIYYAIATADSAPTASQVIAGTVTARLYYGSEFKLANYLMSHKFLSLNDSTTYYCFFVAVDTASNVSSVSKKAFKTLDTTAPTLSNVHPGDLAATSMTLYATASEAATVYYAISASSATPTASDVVGGAVAGAVKSGSAAATAGTPIGASVTGLTASKTYYYYVAAVDASGNQSAVTQGNFILGTVPPTDYVARYRLESNAKDSISGTAMTTGLGDPEFKSDKKKEGSYSAYFNGSQSLMNPSLACGSSMTLSGWVFASGGAPENSFPTAVDIDGFGFYYITDVNRFCAATPSGVSITGPTTPNSGEWVYLTVTYDGTTLSLYINGVLYNSITDTVSVSGTRKLAIGAMNTKSEAWYGYVDDIMVFNRILSAAEVLALYASY